MTSVLLHDQTPTPGKNKKKKLSKSERKRRKRDREQAELLAKEASTSSTTDTCSTSSTKEEELNVHAVETDIDQPTESDDHEPEPEPESIKNTAYLAVGDTKLNLVNETGFTSRKISFVYPIKDKSSGSGKLVSYLHSKLRKQKGCNIGGEDDDNEDETNEEEKVKMKELMGDSIDDILNPTKKKGEKVFDGKKQDKKVRVDEKLQSNENANENDKYRHASGKEEETATPKKKKKGKEKKQDEGTKSPKTPMSIEKNQSEEKKEPDVNSSMEQDTPPIRGRSRSDSLSDPMKTRLSGRTVEDAVKDASGRRPRSNSTDSELNLPKRGLCDERVVIRNYKWDLATFKRAPPRGFINLGNTCFLNSTLQCLTYLPTFCQCVAMLPTNSGGDHGSKKKPNTGLQMAMYVRSLLRRVHGLDGEPKQSAFSPKQIVKAMPTLGGTHRGYKFRPGRQEDAHEFLVHLLNAMNDGELKAAGIDQNKSGWRDKLPIPRLDETTLTHRMFGGYLRSQVCCTKCKYKSSTYDPFLDLSLEVSGKKVRSLYDALSEYTRRETLDVENKWKCSGCKKRVCATKQLTIFRPPLTLCIQLKRFSFGGGGAGGFMHHQGFSHFAGKGMGVMRGGSKVQKQIEFPATLKLPLSDGRKCEYELSGVVVHIGGCATSGHYTAFVRRVGKQGTQQWLNMDDSFVDPVAEKTVLKNKDAYVLFYSRKEVKLELPSPPPVSYTAEEAVKAGQAKAKAKALVKCKADQTDANSTPKKSIVDNDSFMTPDNVKNISKSAPVSRSTTKHEKKSLEAKDKEAPKEKISSESESEDSSGSSVISEYHTADEGKTPEKPPKKKAKSDSGNVVVPKVTEPLIGDQGELSREKVVAPKKTASEKGKMKEIALDMGSRGRVKVMLRKLNNKKKAWKPPTSSKFSSNKETGLLGNRSVSTWDDDNEAESLHEKKQSSKEAKLRETVFTETNLEEKDRKRKMYVNNWDAGLDAGRLKKVKEKKPNWEDEMPKENPFHRIQESMLHMKRGGPKGQQYTSMKKRKRSEK